MHFKILELNFERTWRGGERQTVYNSEGFRKMGHQVSLICRKGYPLEKAASKVGLTVFPFSNIFMLVWFLVMNGRKYDVFHAQTSHILTYCLITKPFHRRPIVFSRRVDFVPKGWLTRFKYRLTDKIVGVSQAVQRIVADFSDRNDVDVISDIVVPRQLDQKEAKKNLTAKGLNSGKRIIGTIAAMVPHKDPLTMVNAIKQLSEIRDDFVFLHFGEGELKNEVQEKVKAYQLENVYQLMGFVQDVENYYSVMEVFVMSSEEEGLGSSVLDAFVYRVPVVGTNAGGLQELLDEGRGVTCQIKHAEQLANGIDKILSTSNNELVPIVDRAYNYVIQKHNLEYITSEYIKVFSSLRSL